MPGHRITLFFSLVLVLVLMLTAIAAAEQLMFQNAAENGGNSVQIPVLLKGADRIGNIDLTLDVSGCAGLKYQNSVAGSLTQSSMLRANMAGSQIRAAIIDSAGISGDGSLIYLQFDLLPGFEGSCDLKIVSAGGNRLDGSPVTFDTRNGKFRYSELLGDVNGDGVITSADSLIISKMAAGLIASTSNADVNRDGKITDQDSLLILSRTMNQRRVAYLEDITRRYEEGKENLLRSPSWGNIVPLLRSANLKWGYRDLDAAIKEIRNRKADSTIAHLDRGELSPEQVRSVIEAGSFYQPLSEFTGSGTTTLVKLSVPTLCSVVESRAGSTRAPPVVTGIRRIEPSLEYTSGVLDATTLSSMAPTIHLTPVETSFGGYVQIPVSFLGNSGGSGSGTLLPAMTKVARTFNSGPVVVTDNDIVYIYGTGFGCPPEEIQSCLNTDPLHPGTGCVKTRSGGALMTVHYSSPGNYEFSSAPILEQKYHLEPATGDWNTAWYDNLIVVRVPWFSDISPFAVNVSGDITIWKKNIESRKTPSGETSFDVVGEPLYSVATPQISIAPKVPVISAIRSNTGDFPEDGVIPGSELFISGMDFGDAPGEVSFVVNEPMKIHGASYPYDYVGDLGTSVGLTVLSWSDTEIRARVNPISGNIDPQMGSLSIKAAYKNDPTHGIGMRFTPRMETRQCAGTKFFTGDTGEDDRWEVIDKDGAKILYVFHGTGGCEEVWGIPTDIGEEGVDRFGSFPPNTQFAPTVWVHNPDGDEFYIIKTIGEVASVIQECYSMDWLECARDIIKWMIILNDEEAGKWWVEARTYNALDVTPGYRPGYSIDIPQELKDNPEKLEQAINVPVRMEVRWGNSCTGEYEDEPNIYETSFFIQAPVGTDLGDDCMAV